MRLLIVSNRLPVTVAEKNHQYVFQESVGGLVTGVRDFLQDTSAESLWIGWPGLSIPEKNRAALKAKMLESCSARPVFLTEREMDKFYHGFCNRTIWPVFHYFPSYAGYDADHWAQYQDVSRIFCETILEEIRPDDAIWIHDFHLMLLPRLLRDKGVQNPIGFFLHIPFPSFELFRVLPVKWRSEILQGILGADLAGFHTHDYTQYFLTCVHRILGLEHNMGEIMANGRLVKAETYPMGIHFDRFYNASENPAVKKEIDRIQKTLNNLSVILSVDRLDYTKGVINRLQGYEIFLERHPEWRGKVVFLLVVVSSRIGVEQYQQMKKQIDEMVGRLNGKWGQVGWTPVVYQYRHLSFDSLAALYHVSDVCLVTPLRDGMNLIAKEYIASRRNGRGVLVLSEMAGASKELGEAIAINPNYREEIAEAIFDALNMPVEEQERRNRIMQDRLRRYTVVRWAAHFLEDLRKVKEEQKQLGTRLFSPGVRQKTLDAFRNAKRRLIFLDYDGTLVPFSKDPRGAVPGRDTLSVLESLCAKPATDVVVISGRDKGTLQNWLGHLPLHLVAEHGIWIRQKGGDWSMIKPLLNDWKPKLLPLLEIYCDRVPGSFIEEKEYSVTWHYRNADIDLSAVRAKELVDDLTAYTANVDISVFQGNRVVEVRSGGVHKGTAGAYFYSGFAPDFSMAVGDDTTDEDLFKALPEEVCTIRVGMTESYARYNLQDHRAVLELLGNF